MTSGMHHVTAITRDVQANVDFWMGFLGLHLVKQTAGFEDADQLHLFYGNATGAPGTLVSFLVWQDGAPGRVGHGQVAEIALAIPRGRIGDWLTRAMQHGLRIEGPTREFDEPVLRLKDPDGIIVKLVGTDIADTGWPAAPHHLRAVTIWSELPEQTAAFLARFGYETGPVEAGVTRLISDSDVLDIRDVSGFVPGIPGTGIIDHVALRMPDVAAIKAHRATLETRNLGEVNVHDRKYFTSLYVREPAGTLVELATDAPGMTADESEDRLGRTLMIPPHFADRAEDLRVSLPQFARPGEERTVMRQLPFTHRIHRPNGADGSTLVLLHGTGGNEADLMPLAHRIAPRAALLGVRGRSIEEGVARFFRRTSMTSFDQDDIRSEAAAFAAFWDGAIAAYGLDRDQITVLGYSNGANFAAAVMGLSPGLIQRAILLRPMAVLTDLPQVDLAGTHVVSLSGERDPYGAYAPALNDWLGKSGADLDARTVAAGHELSEADLTVAQSWMEGERND
ncbi:VOC family protein [Paracoccus sp. R12_1]|uniref:VOC family protein n=1 Tax=unclassified Paracoccus (in: a-proteobacteria) TaxID=2688777 RepID=UPI001ADD1903|nr:MULTISPECIES: VOC family protein [unclassified Paracoccus (in: a-proteobacteria)]MBO9456340.1 VOC family protein [Paracoccus sp. R12_2]MBO9487549.1 VOC family protein [Paracoccus sp. R12_1]